MGLAEEREPGAVHLEVLRAASPEVVNRADGVTQVVAKLVATALAQERTGRPPPEAATL